MVFGKVRTLFGIETDVVFLHALSTKAKPMLRFGIALIRIACSTKIMTQLKSKPKWKPIGISNVIFKIHNVMIRVSECVGRYVGSS
jgi:hypothetical protein